MDSLALPKNWVWARLGDVVSFEYGKGLREDKRNANGRVPVYGSNGIVGYHSVPLVEKPCLVVGRKGAIGAIHLSNKPCWPIDTTYYVLPPDGIDLVFLYHLLYFNRLGSLDKSTAIPGLNRDDAYAVKIPLAPTNEQKRIVARLEELFARLDSGVEGLRKVKAQLKRYRQAVLKYAFEGKLTEEWRKTHKNQTEPAIILLERIKEERKKDPRHEELQLIDVSGLPELPQSWMWVRLGDVSGTTSGGTPSRKKKEYYGGKIPWLKSGELKDGVINATEESITDEGLANSSTRIIPKGTLLIALYGATVGKLGVLGIDSAINQAICAIFPNGGISRDFLFWYLRKHRDELLNIRKGGAQPNISQDVVRKIVLPLPSLQEQQKIVEEIENRMSSMKEVESVLEKSLKQAERLRQGILKQVFEGKLVPQDPSDEPADKLLERIKEARAKSKGEKETKKGRKNMHRQLELSTYVE